MGTMGTLENPVQFRQQDFERLRVSHLRKGALFTDEYFPANINSIGLGLKNKFSIDKIEWRRPSEIYGEPHLIVNGTSLFDICQSSLGDCWVLSVIGSITFKPRLLENIMPRGQGYSKDYAGIFHFRFWHLGECFDVVIDDLLPFLNGKYLSVRPSCENEFWPCLLEKAYAKFLGSYENLHWGDPSNAFMSMTGGLSMTFNLRSTEAPTYWNMFSTASRDTLMACISDPQKSTDTRRGSGQNTEYPDTRRGSGLSNDHPDTRRGSGLNIEYPGTRRGSGLNNNNPELIDNAPEKLRTNHVTESEQRVHVGNLGSTIKSDKLAENPLLEKGIVDRHAYSITELVKVPFRDGYVKLVRIWNPWGYGEWKGNWNDRCPLWKELREEDRLSLLRINEDGQFWMCWEDFIKEFSKLIICNHVPDFLDCGDQHKKWYRNTYRGRWTKDHMSWKNLDKDFLKRYTLYSINVTGSDQGKSGVNVVLSLQQSNRNKQKTADGHWLPIGFVLFELPDSLDKTQSASLTLDKIPVINSYKMLNVTETLKLAPGRYGVIPYTTQKEHECSFLFQVFLKSKDSTNDIGRQQNIQGLDDPRHESIFRHYATQGFKLYAWDLKRLLNDMVTKEFPHPYERHFTIDGCREILKTVDISRKGRIYADTFVPLWKTIIHYKDLFFKVDINRSGDLCQKEFCELMQQAGFKIHKDLLHEIFARYSDAEWKLGLVDCLICMLRLHAAVEKFSKLSTDGIGVYVHYEKWIQLMM